MVTQTIGQSTDFSELSSNDQQIITHAFIYLEYDFYLEAIAHVEVGFLLLLKKHKAITNINTCQWFLSKAINAYALSLSHPKYNSVGTCFGGILHVMKDDTAFKTMAKDENTEGGWRKLATFIEIDQKGSSEALNQKQYEQIKRWRKGKDIPSIEARRTFINRYLKYIGRSGSEMLELCFRILLMLDKVERELLATAQDKAATKDQIRKVLARYPVYHRKCLDQELQ